MTTSEDIKNAKTIRELNSFEIKQKDFICSKYPMLDDFMVDTIVRLNEAQRDDIVAKMKSGEIGMEEPKDPSEYILQSVKVSE